MINNLNINSFPSTWTVSNLNVYIKKVLTQDKTLQSIWVKGEISDFKRAYSGHCYFKLKDRASVINCVMFQSRAQRINFDIKGGLNVLALGSITLYEKGGSYQLLVEKLNLEGLGDIYLNYLQLKEKLEKKGYFDEGIKKRIPFMPKGIGVATSPSGAVIRDIITTVNSLFPNIPIYIAPAIVQGSDAPESIINALKMLDKFEKADVIILARGGGSFEDLNCFNDEGVAEALFKCNKPVISAVGHETDFTIADFTADLRAATPTAAAQKAVPSKRELKQSLALYKDSLVNNMESIIDQQKSRLEAAGAEKLTLMVKNKVQEYVQELDRMMFDLVKNLDIKLEKQDLSLQKAGENLNALNPFRVLERGFAIVQDGKTSEIIPKAQKLTPLQDVKIVFCDGSAKAEIIQDGIVLNTHNES